MIQRQGMYLLWFDRRALGFGADGLEDSLLNQARINLDEGYIFDPKGVGFDRIVDAVASLRARPIEPRLVSGRFMDG